MSNNRHQRPKRNKNILLHPLNAVSRLRSLRLKDIDYTLSLQSYVLDSFVFCTPSGLRQLATYRD